jgi:hypothetical protein
LFGDFNKESSLGQHQHGTRFTVSPPGHPWLKYKSLNGQLKVRVSSTVLSTDKTPPEDEEPPVGDPPEVGGNNPTFGVANLRWRHVQSLISSLVDRVMILNTLIFPAGAVGRLITS